MLTGKTFRLKSATLAIETLDASRHAVTLPVGAIIHVTGGPTKTDTRMVDVRWLEKPLVIFTVDLLERGEEVKEN